jgi:amino acid adenylation domain-containing protein
MTTTTPTRHAAFADLGYVGARDLLEAVERWERQTPDAVAVRAPDGTATFADVAEQARRLVFALADRGVRAQTAVAHCLGRSRHGIAALLALWRLGATVVPLDERHPPDRLRAILDDAGATMVLDTGRLPSEVDTATVSATTVDVASLDGGDGAAVPTSSPLDCAYLIYTSGTTGRPKGVEVTYRGLDAFLAALSRLRLTPGGVGVNAVSPAFDGWLWCTLLYLLHGQGTAIVDLEDGTGLDLAERIAQLSPRTVCLTPSLLAATDSDLAGVEVLVVAGETCPPALAERYRAGRRLLNVYGPTEATIAATWADSGAGDDPTTIGRALPGYLTYVLDDAFSPVQEGELFIGGPAVARGYRHRPGLTAARFVPDPFAGGGARMYRTGDLVRERADGQLEYLGRRDEQLKVRGHRVEPAEVERVAAQTPGVSAAACFVLPAGDALGLAVATVDGFAVDLDVVKARCAARLPAAMVPSALVTVSKLPTLPTGKVDRAALAQLATAPTLSTREPSATVLPTRQAQVAAVFAELLGHQVDDVDADFFDIGGHSLLAARVVSALRRETGLRLSMRHFLANPTVAALAGELDALAGEPTGSEGS